MKFSFGIFCICAQGSALAFSPRQGHVSRNTVLNMVSAIPGTDSKAVESPEEVRHWKQCALPVLFQSSSSKELRF
jgi:hypothetical protein